MITDALVNFIAPGSALSITTASTYYSNTYDVLGLGVGVAPNNIIGNASLFGQDPGIGGFKPQLESVVGTAFVGGTSVQVALQASPDVASTYTPTTWTTLVQTAAILTASLVAGFVMARFDWPPAVPSSMRPRFFRLAYTSVGTFSAGTIGFALVTMVRDDQANKYAPANFSVA